MMNSRRFMSFLLPLILVMGSFASGAGAAAILDQTCWLRRYYRFAADLVSPVSLRSEGLKLLGSAQYDRLMRTTQKSLAVSGNDRFAVFRPSPLALREARRAGTWSALRKPAPAGPAGDWTDLVFQRMFFDPYTAPPAAPDWASPAFDDSDWVLDRGPFQADMPDDLPPQATSGNMAKVHVGALQYIGSGIHAACYRARFAVDDPAKAGDLTFSAAYRGGLRVLINGQEVARGHLPEGELAPDASGEDYPLAAYTIASLRDRSLGPVRIPQQLLRAGTNILAIEVRASLLHPTILKTPQSNSWNALHDREGLWRHGFLGRFELRSPDVSMASAKIVSAGLRVWTRDMHSRVYSDDTPPPGESTGIIRLVGPQNGLCSGQIVIASDKDLSAIAVEASELRAAGGPATVAASAINVSHMMPVPAELLSDRLGDERGLAGSFPAQAELQQFATMANPQKVYAYDQITPRPQPLPAGRCRPLWLSVHIPADASPGRYSGMVRVGADNQDAVIVPVELEVMGWRLPEPREFQTYVGCEENPYAVARQYGVPLWSDAHFILLESSFRQLGRIGGKWLNIPVIRGTEFGNRDDSPIRWVRRRDGSLANDFAVLDKYLDLAIKHIGVPRMINFVVMPGMSSAQNIPAVSEVMVIDEATGRASALLVGGPGVSLADKRKIWLPFATALHEHLKTRGLEKATHWGYPLDSEVDHDLVVLLGQHLPGVKWNGGPHQIGSWGYKEPKYYDVFGTVRYFDNWPGFRMKYGWKSPQVQLSIPRIDSSVQSLITASFPFGFRTLVNHSLALGRCGFVRVGADEWASTHYDGMRVPTWIVGMPVLFTLWPGQQGAESSARFEALIEGIQEGEARIYLEKALDGGRLPLGLARRAGEALDRHYLETTFFQNKLCIHELERYHYGWQQRSRELYQAAADVAAAGAAAGGRQEPR